MRIAGTAALVLGLSTSAFAQVNPRLELGPVVRLDGLYFEGGMRGAIGVSGLSARVRASNRLAIEGELTQGFGHLERSYEGWFVSYVPDTVRNPTREEIERFAPTARRTLGYGARYGWSVALVVRDAFKSRVPVNFRIGGTGRQYRETSDYVILTIPEGIDPARVARDFQSASYRKIRGGLLLGADVALKITDRFSVTPLAQMVWSGPAQVGNTYREHSIGIRAGWGF